MRRLREKERKQAEKEARAARKAAAAEKTGTLDSFINRVKYKVDRRSLCRVVQYKVPVLGVPTTARDTNHPPDCHITANPVRVCGLTFCAG